MRTLRAALFGLAEGVRLYLEAVRRGRRDGGEFGREARPVGAGLGSVVEGGGG
jgi:hypothetical protein